MKQLILEEDKYKNELYSDLEQSEKDIMENRVLDATEELKKLKSKIKNKII